jgi:hypothetical protein
MKSLAAILLVLGMMLASTAQAGRYQETVAYRVCSWNPTHHWGARIVCSSIDYTSALAERGDLMVSTRLGGSSYSDYTNPDERVAERCFYGYDSYEPVAYLFMESIVEAGQKIDCSATGRPY